MSIAFAAFRLRSGSTSLASNHRPWHDVQRSISTPLIFSCSIADSHLGQLIASDQNLSVPLSLIEWSPQFHLRLLHHTVIQPQQRGDRINQASSIVETSSHNSISNPGGRRDDCSAEKIGAECSTDDIVSAQQVLICPARYKGIRTQHN